jgi:hypothetical protein
MFLLRQGIGISASLEPRTRCAIDLARDEVWIKRFFFRGFLSE